MQRGQNTHRHRGGRWIFGQELTVGVSEAVTTIAGQVGKPHPVGTGEEDWGGWRLQSPKWKKQVSVPGALERCFLSEVRAG